MTTTIPMLLLYTFVMAAVTYLIRMLPFVVFRKPIKNRALRSFLYYVPYVTLAVMTFPAILSATGSLWSALAALAAAVVLSLCKCKLPLVALAACAAVLGVEFLLF